MNKSIAAVLLLSATTVFAADEHVQKRFSLEQEGLTRIQMMSHAMERAGEYFDRIDIDGDGVLSAQEIAFKEKLKTQRAKEKQAKKHMYGHKKH